MSERTLWQIWVSFGAPDTHRRPNGAGGSSLCSNNKTTTDNDRETSFICCTAACVASTDTDRSGGRGEEECSERG